MALVRQGNDLVARVVAWHNRHPLARRIAPAHVVSLGLVSVPFVVPAGRAAVRAAQGAGRPQEAEDPPSAAAPPEGAAADAPTALPSPDAVAPGPGEAAEPAAAGAAEPAAGSLRERAEARSRAQGGRAAPASSGAPREGTARAQAPGAADTRARKAWRAAFAEDLLDPSSPRVVARFARAMGVVEHPGPADSPVRELEVATPVATRGGRIVRLWLYTAAIDLGAQRVRVLVAPGDGRRVLGPRLMGRTRLAAAASFAGLVLAAGALWAPVGRGGASAAKAPLAAAPPQATKGQAASAAPTLAARASAAAGATSATATPATPAAAASAAAEGAGAMAHAAAASASLARTPAGAAQPESARPAAAASMPTTAVAAATPPPRPATAPEGDRKALAHVVPFLSEATRLAAREASEQAREERARLRGPARAERAAPAPPAASAAALAPSHAAHRPGPPITGPAHALATPPARAAASPAPAQAWAVSTRNLRTRFESEQMLAALRDVAYRSGHGSDLKLEVLPAGEDWRAVGWPLATRAEAERLREALAARGLKAEVLQF